MGTVYISRDHSRKREAFCPEYYANDDVICRLSLSALRILRIGPAEDFPEFHGRVTVAAYGSVGNSPGQAGYRSLSADRVHITSLIARLHYGTMT